MLWDEVQLECWSNVLGRNQKCDKTVILSLLLLWLFFSWKWRILKLLCCCPICIVLLSCKEASHLNVKGVTVEHESTVTPNTIGIFHSKPTSLTYVHKWHFLSSKIHKTTAEGIDGPIWKGQPELCGRGVCSSVQSCTKCPFVQTNSDCVACAGLYCRLYLLTLLNSV